VAGLSGSPDSPANGTVEVQTISGPDGAVRHVVYLPGTDDVNPPWEQDADVRDLEPALDAVSGRPDAYQQGILEALHRAGVGTDEPVLIVGHSLGGMEAAAILAGHGGYHVTDVVTAGSPTAQVPGFPSGSHVLSLEQRGDIVPELDGAPNPDSVEQTTVTFDAHPAGGVTEHHAYDVYEKGAGLVDAATDPSVTDAVGALHDHGFLGSGGDVTSQVFQITRAP
jgi:pimeloyl-ACP methyl ester carboxylesterase